MNKYNKVMENIEVTEDMKSRILQEVESRDKRKEWLRKQQRKGYIKVTAGVLSAAAVLVLCINVGNALKNAAGKGASMQAGSSSMPPEYDKNYSVSATNGPECEDKASDKQLDSMVIDGVESFYGYMDPEDAKEELENLEDGEEIGESGGITGCDGVEDEIDLKVIKRGSLYYRAYVFCGEDAYCIFINVGVENTEIFFKAAKEIIK